MLFTEDVTHRLAGIHVFPINALPAAGLVPEGIDTLCHEEAVKFEAMRRYYDMVDADLLFCFSDIAIQAEAMGAPVRYASDEMPAVCAPAGIVRVPRACKVPRMALNGQVVRRMRTAYPRRRIAALVYGPFTVVGQLTGEQNALRRVREAPAALAALLVEATAMAEDYARLLLDAGADLLWISDPLAALLPPPDFDGFAGRYLRQLFGLMSDGQTILHICGETSDLLAPMMATGAGGISFDQCMVLPAVEAQVPRQVAMIGNLDPVEVVTMAPLHTVCAATRELAATMGIRSNFILSTGCALPPGTPIENVRAFIHSGREAVADIRRHAAYLAPLVDAVTRGDAAATVQTVGRALAGGRDSLRLLDGGLVRAMRQAGARYEAKQCHLPELLMSVDAFYEGFARLKTRLPGSADAGPRVMLGTVQGDLHAIGKDLVRIMLEANGVGVVDLGVDVSKDRFVAAMARYRPAIIGLSAFLTAARRQLPALIGSLRSKGNENLKVVLGGAAVNAVIATEVGADGYARDAVAAVKLIHGLITDLRAGEGASR